MLVLKVSLFCGRERTKNKRQGCRKGAPRLSRGPSARGPTESSPQCYEMNRAEVMKTYEEAEHLLNFVNTQGQRVKTRKKKVSERENDITETMIRLSVGILE